MVCSKLCGCFSWCAWIMPGISSSMSSDDSICSTYQHTSAPARREAYRVCKVKDSASCNRRFFMVVLDLDVDDVDNAVVLAAF